MVCLILGPTLTSRPCLHTFWVLTSLHHLPFLLKMFFIILLVLVLVLVLISISVQLLVLLLLVLISISTLLHYMGLFIQKRSFKLISRSMDGIILYIIYMYSREKTILYYNYKKANI